MTKCDEYKHHEVAFQLAALIFQNSRDKHQILKDNSWICILNLYHKTSGLKLCTARGKWGKYTHKYISLFIDGGAQVNHVFLLLS